MKQIQLLTIAALALFTACNQSPEAKKLSCCSDDSTSAKTCSAMNTLTEQEKAEGWQLLFDGKTIDQWHSFNNNNAMQGWGIEDGHLKSLGLGGDTGGDIVTNKEYENFELSLEWKIAHGGNSGVFYGIIEDPKYHAGYNTGPEYQLLDDVGFPEKVEEWQMTGADYGMHLADKSVKKLQMVGGNEFNTTKIIVNGTHVEHWLNGEKIVSFERWTPEWMKMKTEGKWKDYLDYGMAKKGKLGLQDHGSVIWFKNIKIKELPSTVQ